MVRLSRLPAFKDLVAKVEADEVSIDTTVVLLLHLDINQNLCLHMFVFICNPINIV